MSEKLASEQREQPDGLSRRQVLKRGAAVGVAAAWAVPLVQVVSMTPAHADSPSVPGGGGGSGGGGGGGSTPPTEPPTTHTPTRSVPSGSAPAAASPSATASPADVSGALAQTGTTVPVGPAVGIGAAAIALGAGAMAAAQIRRNRTDDGPAHTE